MKSFYLTSLFIKFIQITYIIIVSSLTFFKTLKFFLQFKEISFAYEVLSKPEKKDLYDRHGIQGLKEGMGGGGQSDFFEDLFGGFMGGRGGPFGFGGFFKYINIYH